MDAYSKNCRDNHNVLPTYQHCSIVPSLRKAVFQQKQYNFPLFLTIYNKQTIQQILVFDYSTYRRRFAEHLIYIQFTKVTLRSLKCGEFLQTFTNILLSHLFLIRNYVWLVIKFFDIMHWARGFSFHHFFLFLDIILTICKSLRILHFNFFFYIVRPQSR